MTKEARKKIGKKLKKNRPRVHVMPGFENFLLYNFRGKKSTQQINSKK